MQIQTGYVWNLWILTRICADTNRIYTDTDTYRHRTMYIHKNMYAKYVHKYIQKPPLSSSTYSSTYRNDWWNRILETVTVSSQAYLQLFYWFANPKIMDLASRVALLLWRKLHSKRTPFSGEFAQCSNIKLKTNTTIANISLNASLGYSYRASYPDYQIALLANSSACHSCSLILIYGSHLQSAAS